MRFFTIINCPTKKRSIPEAHTSAVRNPLKKWCQESFTNSTEYHLLLLVDRHSTTTATKRPTYTQFVCTPIHKRPFLISQPGISARGGTRQLLAHTHNRKKVNMFHFNRHPPLLHDTQNNGRWRERLDIRLHLGSLWSWRGAHLCNNVTSERAKATHGCAPTLFLSCSLINILNASLCSPTPPLLRFFRTHTLTTIERGGRVTHQDGDDSLN